MEPEFKEMLQSITPPPLRHVGLTAPSTETDVTLLSLVSMNVLETCHSGRQSTDSSATTLGKVHAFGTPSALNHLPTPKQILPDYQSNPQSNLFKFINIHEPSGKADSIAGFEVRSHITRGYHDNRRRRKKNPPRTLEKLRKIECTHTKSYITPIHHSRPISDSDQAPSLLGIPEVICIQCGRSLLQYLPSNGQRLLDTSFGSLGYKLSSNSHDPFDSAAISITHRMHGLIHHFLFHHLITSNPPIYFDDGFPALMSLLHIKSALQDAVCIHAIVAFSAFQKSRLKSRGALDWKAVEERNWNLREATGHLHEAARLLNKKLEDPKEALSVTSLLGAAFMGAYAFEVGDTENCIAHHRGMVKMIELRGGIDTLPRGLANQMCRIDAFMSWWTQSYPALPMYSSPFLTNGIVVSAINVYEKSDLLLDHQRHTSKTPRYSPLLNDILKTFLCSQLFAIACDMHSLSYMLDLHRQQPRKTGNLERAYIEDTFASILHSIISFPFPNNISIIKSTTYYCQHCWTVGAILYLNTAIRRWDPSSLAAKAQVSQLIIALRIIDLSVMKSTFPEILLWLLFVGACAARDIIDRGWLLGELRHGIGVLGLAGPQELEILLRSLLCTEALLQENLKPIWQEINPE